LLRLLLRLGFDTLRISLRVCHQLACLYLCPLLSLADDLRGFLAGLCHARFIVLLGAGELLLDLLRVFDALLNALGAGMERVEHRAVEQT